MKRRVVGVFLVLFAIWPLVQYALVLRYGIDPWKLFGWAMYSVPGPMKTIRIVGLSDDGSQRRFDFARYSPEAQRAVDVFRSRRGALGSLASTEELARRMLELHPDLDGMLVRVISLELDPTDALVHMRKVQETHWRDGRDEPFRLGRPSAP